MITPYIKDRCLISNIDHPGKTSFILYTDTQKCDLNCYGCHNKREKVTKKEYMSGDVLYEEAYNAYRLGAKVCIICGGCPLFFTDQIIETISIFKKFFKIRIDTNGQHPDEVEKIISYVDGFGVDIKLPIKEKYNGEARRYREIIGTKDINKYKDNLLKTINMVDLMPLTLYRTVIYPLFTPGDMVDIVDFTNGLNRNHNFNQFYEVT